MKVTISSLLPCEGKCILQRKMKTFRVALRRSCWPGEQDFECLENGRVVLAISSKAKQYIVSFKMLLPKVQVEGLAYLPTVLILSGQF